MRTKLIEDRLNLALKPTYLSVEDESAEHYGHAGAQSGGGHFAVTIVSAEFTNKSSVQRHQMVYKALGDLMNSEIHAVSINAKTEEEYK